MALFEDLGRKLSMAGQSAMEKTKQMTEIAKIHAKLEEQKKERDKVFKDIGELYSLKYKDSAPEEFKEMLAQIDTINEKIDEYNKDMDVVKGIKRCPHCNNAMEIKDAFCSNCGEPVPVPEEESFDVDETTCPKCGNIVTEGAKFCPECGNELKQAKENFDETGNEQLIEMDICPDCGATIKSDAQECPACGADMKNSANKDE